MNAADAYVEVMGMLSDAALTGRRQTATAPGAVLCLGGSLIPFLNGVFTGSATADPAAVEELAAAASASGLPWSIQVRDKPEPEIRAVAARYGLGGEHAEPLMTCPASDARWSTSPAEDLSIRTIDASERDVFVATTAAGYEMPEEVAASLLTVEFMQQAGATNYLGVSDGEPVAVAWGVRTGDWIGVFNIATRPDARRRGFGRRLTERAMRDGFEQGATAAFLASSPEGYPLYRSIGYTTVETFTYLFDES